MGCDIHAMIERRKWYGKREFWDWLNAGDPDIDRNYTIFAVLANVRNYDNTPFISEPRGLPEDCTSEFKAYAEEWDADGHSHSWVTLKEMKAFDTSQKYFCSSLILGRDENGNITSICRATTLEHYGPVGEVSIFRVFGEEGITPWTDLIKKLEAISGGHDEDVRLVFFFDN